MKRWVNIPDCGSGAVMETESESTLGSEENVKREISENQELLNGKYFTFNVLKRVNKKQLQLFYSDSTQKGGSLDK